MSAMGSPSVIGVRPPVRGYPSSPGVDGRRLWLWRARVNGNLADGRHARLVRDGGAPVEGFAVVPGAGRPAVVLPYDDVGGAPARGLTMDHRAMVACLRAEVAARPGVEIRTGERVVELLRAGERV